MKVKTLILFLMILPLVSCSLLGYKKKCLENLEFKSEFFKQVELIENFTKDQNGLSEVNQNISEQSFLKAEEFVAKHTGVSITGIYNYQLGYASFESYMVQKKKWLSWYNKHKCEYLK